MTELIVFLDHCAAHLIRHYPRLKLLNSEAPVVKRLEEYALAAKCQLSDLMVWSMKLNEMAAVTNENETEASAMTDQRMHQEYQAMIKYQAAVISGLIEHNKQHNQRWEQCIDAVESQMQVKKRRVDEMEVSGSCEANGEEEDEIAHPKKKKSATTHLLAVWYKWYTREPRLWNSDASRQHVSNSRNTVAFMKLFIDQGVQLSEGAVDFKEAAMAYGVGAEAVVVSFLADRGVAVQGAGSVLKHMREAHREGALNDRILAYKARLGADGIADPAPRKSQDILKMPGFEPAPIGCQPMVCPNNSASAFRLQALRFALRLLTSSFLHEAPPIPLMKPTKNAISSRKEFKTHCMAAMAPHMGQDFRLTEEGIRHLRLALNEIVATSIHLPEALSVIVGSLSQMSVRLITSEHLTDWIAQKVDNGKAEHANSEDLSSDALHGVRKVLASKRVYEKKEGEDKGTWMTYFLLDWQLTWEPRQNVNQTCIAEFRKSQRVLVRQAYIESEAKEDNSMNPQ